MQSHKHTIIMLTSTVFSWTLLVVVFAFILTAIGGTN